MSKRRLLSLYHAMFRCADFLAAQSQSEAARRPAASAALTIRPEASMSGNIAFPCAGVSRRQFVVVLASGITAVVPADSQDGGAPHGTVACRLIVNGRQHDLLLD